MIGQLADEVKISQAITLAAGVSGTSTIAGAVIDMSGYDGLLVVVQMGAITAGAVTSIKLQQDTLVGMTAAADLLGTGQAIADSDDDKVFYIDIKRPLEQFVRLFVSRATQASALSAMYFQYRGRTKPAVQPAGVAGEKWISPIEGTA